MQIGTFIDKKGYTRCISGWMECWKNLNQTDTEEIATTVKGMVDDEDDEVRMFALQMSTML